jgi:hypothetical protein
VWLGGDFDDPASFEPRSIDAGDVSAEGTTAVAGYRETPLDRLHFIVDAIRAHVLRPDLHGPHRRRGCARVAPGPAAGVVPLVRDPARFGRLVGQPTNILSPSAICSIVLAPAAIPITNS